VAIAGGGMDTDNSLRKQLAKESKKKELNGGALRWAISATYCGRSELQLQGLPVPMSVVSSKPILRSDDIAVVVLASWPLAMEMWDGEDGLRGPVPVIYADQPEDIRSKIAANLDGFWAQLNKLMTRYKFYYI